jgi:hypothetical protein
MVRDARRLDRAVLCYARNAALLTMRFILRSITMAMRLEG